MLINMILPGAVGEELFAFEYSGNYTDNRVNGVGTVRLNTSGTLTVTSGTATVSAYIRAGGGGGLRYYSGSTYGQRLFGGGGGGYQTVNVELSAGTYEIVIGSGGAGHSSGYTYESSAYSFAGGNTAAFGYTCTGGGRAYCHENSSSAVGAGGSPNGGDGNYASSTSSNVTAAGGSPNGGSASYSNGGQSGGDGYVELTFS